MVEPLEDYIKYFVSSRSATTQRGDLERSWFFSAETSSSRTSLRGYIHYGTYGFESNLVDPSTQKTNYRRQRNDVEEIPLYFEFWFPPAAKYGLIALQSFQSRSCVGIVLGALREHFDVRNGDVKLRIKKLMPGDVKGSLFAKSPVKKISLVKKSIRSDLADQYTGGGQSSEVNIEVSLSAQRRGTLGTLRSITDYLSDGDRTAVLFDGIEFDEAVAEIAIGGRRRRVGVFGKNSEAGVIDLTDSLTKGLDGHPTFESLTQEVRAILGSFHQTLSGTRR